YSSGLQQVAIPAPYQDQVHAAGLAAWRKFDEGPTESPIAGIHQKINEDLPTFIKSSIKKKMPPGDLRDHFIKMMVWEGMTAEHKMACSGLKERSMECWVIATKDIGSSSYHAKTLATALQATRNPPLIPICPVPLVLDSPRKAFKLPEGPSPAPLNKGRPPVQTHWTVPLVPGLRPKMTLTIGGKPFKFLIDTGAD
ncbi:olfactory receptor 10C1-like protein, partial [Leptotrombidium deliense]